MCVAALLLATATLPFGTPSPVRAQPAPHAVVPPRRHASPDPGPRPSAGGLASSRERSLRGRLTGPALARALSDPSVSRRVEAAESLGRVGAAGPAVDALVESLPAEPARPVRIAIARALARRADPRSIPALVAAFADARGADDDVLAAALSVFATGESIDALLGALSDPTRSRAAADALVRVGARAIPLLVAHLREVPDDLQAIDVLGRIGSALATPALLDALATGGTMVRAAALTALERIGDPRAAPAAIAVLDDPDPFVRRAAVAAVGALGTPEDGRALDRFLTGSPDTDAPTWRALLRLDAARAADALASIAPHPAIVAVAVERPRPELLPAYERWIGATPPDGVPPGALLAAVAELGSADAFGILARVAGERPASGPTSVRELALALDRGGAAIDGAARARAREVIRSTPHAAERLLLLAIAGAGDAGSAVDAALRGDDVAVRAAAAIALATTEVPCEPETVLRLARETDDPELFRRLAEAGVRCGVAARPEVHRRFAYGEEAGPEAMAWAAASSRDAPREVREALGRELREALRSPSARIRAGGARALALLGDEGARAARAPLVRDRDPGVRRAAARALEVLGPGEQRAELEAAARVETETVVRAGLEDAARASTGRAPLPVDRRGGAWYASAPASSGTVRVDVVDALGRFRRFEIGPSPLLIVGLPDGPVRPIVVPLPTPPGERLVPSSGLAAPVVGP